MQASAKDTMIGGDEFDNRLLEQCITRFSKESGTRVAAEPTALIRLRILCE
jgi:molecular chaperone DnaK (HSP70)